MKKCLTCLLWATFATTACLMSAQAAQNLKLPELRAPSYVPLVAPGWYNWIFDPGVPVEARRRLEPLYQDLDYLQRIRIPVALLQVQDRASDFLAAGEKAINSEAANLVTRSATGKSELGQKFDTPESMGWDIGSEIREKEGQINAIRHEYGLDFTIGAAPKPFNISSIFNQDGVKNWLSKTEEIRRAWESAYPLSSGVTTDTPVPSELIFDPSTLSPSEYAGWLANQQKMSAETLGQSDPELRLQELRRKAAQAQSDLNDAQQQYEVQTSQDAYRSPGNGDVTAPGTPARSGVQNPGPSIYPQITTSSQWQSPRNYRCANGPCTLEQWQQENTSKTNQCSGAGCTGSYKAGNNGQTPVPTHQPQKPPQPACQGNPQLGGYSPQACPPSPQPPPASGGDYPLSHAWLCQQLASIVQHDKNSLGACRPKDQLCIQMFQAAVQSDLKSFNSNNCDAKLLH